MFLMCYPATANYCRPSGSPFIRVGMFRNVPMANDSNPTGKFMLVVWGNSSIERCRWSTQWLIDSCFRQENLLKSYQGRLPAAGVLLSSRVPILSISIF